MSIEIRNVTKSFGDTQALDHVTLTLEKNQIYGLLGNNGAGKTTLLSILTDRQLPTEGSVLVDGQNVRNNDEALGKVFMVGEQNLFPEDMRVWKAFRVAQLFYPSFDRSYAKDAAERFGLNPKKKIASLSTGYASIFRLILGLSVSVPYLIFDEPVLGLDAQHRDLFYRMLMEKAAQASCTIVISTHLIIEVENLVNRALIIRNGRMIKDGPTEDLLADAYTISGPVGAMDAYLSGKHVLSMSVLGGLKTACVQGKPDSELPRELEISKPNLQEYFISLMEEGQR